MFVDRHWVVVPGGQAAVEVIDGVIYLAMQVRNVGNGMALIETWQPFPTMGTEAERAAEVEKFRPQTRSLLVPPGDVAFWQGALREESDSLHAAMTQAVERGELSVDLLYRDHEGGQRTITRFGIVRDEDGERWWTSMTRHRSAEVATPGR